VPDGFEGRSGATLKIRTVSSPPVSAIKELTLQPGPIAQLEVSADRTQLPADGHASTALTVRATDAFGNPVSNARLHSSSAGTISAFSMTDPGVYSASYVPPIERPDVDRVVIRDQQGSARGELSIELESPSNLLVSAHAGYLTNFGKVSSPIVSANLWLRLPVLEQRLVAGVGIAYYSSSFSEADADNQERVEAEMSVVPLLGSLMYELGWHSLTPYAGVAAGAALVGTRLSSESSGDMREAHTVFIVSPVVGALYPLGPGELGLRLAYVYSHLNGSLEGNAGGLHIAAGYRLAL
jgi:hypothetical protein